MKHTFEKKVSNITPNPDFGYLGTRSQSVKVLDSSPKCRGPRPDLQGLGLAIEVSSPISVELGLASKDLGTKTRSWSRPRGTQEQAPATQAQLQGFGALELSDPRLRLGGLIPRHRLKDLGLTSADSSAGSSPQQSSIDYV